MIRPSVFRVLLAGAALGAIASVGAALVLRGAHQSIQTSLVRCPQLPGPGGMIDGSTEPDLIPDSAAYRLYFLSVTVTANGTDAERARQAAVLRYSGVADQDLPPAVGTLADFRASYDQLVAQYNDSVAQADKEGRAPDLATFLSRRDALVQSLRDALKVNLSARSMARLDTHVHQQKRFMRVAREVVQ